MKDRTEQLAFGIRSNRERLASAFRFATLLLLFVTFFGGLLASIFELFRFVDFLLVQERRRGWTFVWQTGVVFVVGVLAIRISWWLSLAILGLVTRKYDLAGFIEDTIPLARSDYAALYERVDDICRHVKAPRPDRILLNPWPECYVLEERRFSLSTKRSLTLVVGLPQMLVFNIAELRVVLAHEMAHFGNRDTTLVVFLFRFVESLRIALSQMQQRWWHRLDPLYWFFATFYALLHRVASPIQRRLEMRADQISATLCGGGVAAHTLLKDWFLDGQFDEAVQIYRRLDVEDASSANLYQLFADRWRELSPDAEQYLAQRLAQEHAQPASDSHPTTHARLELLRQFPAVDFHDTKPALALLPGLQDLQRQAARVLNRDSASD